MSTIAEAERAALVALASLSRVGPAALLRALDEGPAKVWASVVAGHPERSPALASLKTTGMVAEARAIDPAELLARHRAEGVEVVVLGDLGYPDRLLDDPAPPVVLFASGPMSAALSAHRPIAAIVGTRNATRLGRDTATVLGRDLAAAGVVVVSGLALGIDGAAHRGALAAPSPAAPVVGVVAAGLDITYPRRHTDLHRQVTDRGVLISETPLGCRPTTWRFPARNRIIAGLSDVVVVVESRAKGGSMLTAEEAGDRGVEVMAVPGHPTAPAAVGTNALIADGSSMARDSRDVLEHLGVRVPSRTHRGSATSAVVDAPLDVRQRSVLDALGDQPTALEEAVMRCHLTVEETAEVLTELQVRGLVSCTSGWYERTAGAMGRS